MYSLKLLVLSILFCSTNILMAQNNKTNFENAQLKIEAGEYAKAIEILKPLNKNAQNGKVAMELGFCYYQLRKFDKVIETLEPLNNGVITSANYYQMLGNSYDENYNRTKAITVYKKGLDKFPNNGNLYYELGIIHISDKKLPQALNYFEKGILQDPTYAGNYYWASKLFANSNNQVWALLYGEQFMNIEPNTKRAKEMSNLLIAIYQKAIEYNGDGTANANFTNSKFLVDSLNKNAHTNFEDYCIKLNYTIAASNNGAVTSTANLYDLRNVFWLEVQATKQDSLYKNNLFEYWKTMDGKGFWQCYNYWLLQENNADEVKVFVQLNEKKWLAFIDWFRNNPLPLNSNNHLHRMLFK